MSTVSYKKLDPVTVYAVRGIAEGMGPEHVGPVVGPLIESLDQALLAAGRPIIEPGIFWYDEAPDDRLAVSVSYGAEAEPIAGDGYEVVVLPEVPMAATMVHRGELSTIGESWARLMEQAATDGYRLIGSCREVYLEADGHVPGPDWVTELQVPVERV
jgi:effector-binding domain-containing protein